MNILSSDSEFDNIDAEFTEKLERAGLRWDRSNIFSCKNSGGTRDLEFYNQADLAYTAGDLPTAVRHYHTIISKFPSSCYAAHAHVGLGEYHAKNGANKIAKSAFTKAFKSTSPSAQFHAGRGLCRIEFQKKRRSAERCYAKLAQQLQVVQRKRQ